MHSHNKIEIPLPVARPWWKEPYVWMVISGPLSAVLAVYIFQGPDAVVPEDNYQAGVEIRRKLEAAPPPLQPAQMGRNHSATGGKTYEKP